MSIRNVECMHDSMSVLPNSCAWEQQEWYKTKKQRKKVRWEEWIYEKKKSRHKKCSYGLRVAYAYHPQRVTTPKSVDALPTEPTLKLELGLVEKFSSALFPITHWFYRGKKEGAIQFGYRK